MHRQQQIFMLLIIVAAVLTVTAAVAIAQVALTDQSKVTLYGIGSVRVGMTPAEAEAAAGTRLIAQEGTENCYYLNPQDKPKDIGFMIVGDRITRVDIWKNTRVTTVKGAKIGDSEARIKSLYPGQIQVTNHAYVQGGHYLTFVPRDRSDRNYRLVFETNARGKVTEYRAGKLPEVEYIEGCA